MTGFDRRRLLAIAAATLATPAFAQTRPAPAPKRTPMTTGHFSKTRLARMHEIMAAHVTSGFVPGLMTLVSRRGETHVDAIGTTAFGGSTPMRRDTIFRVASLTKPVTAAAAMMLVEDGKLRLDDPVDRLLPELADRKVLRSIESPLTDTVPASRPITLRDLLTFRLGYGAVMVFPERHPVQFAMREAGIAPGPQLIEIPADEMMQRFGRLPLFHQPGEKWLYNSGSDILGVLIARASGKSFGAFLQERMFAPLGMADTGFHVPAAQAHRLPTLYQRDFSTGKLEVFDGPQGRFTRPPVFESGAGGLVSTVDDLLAFNRMLLARGRHDHARILSHASVELMTTDHITPEQKAASPFVPGFWDARGWGFGVAVTTRRDDVFNIGRFGWDGGYGTSCYVDPKEEMIGILLTQRLMDSPTAPPTYVDFWNAAYAAIN
jgi:CubicO group peptidase (beta-lactamase class C family)